jgi:hypothetical protein
LAEHENLDELTPEHRIRAAAQALATLRARPCVALVGVDLDRDLIRPLRHTLAEIDGDAVDVLLASHGGQLDAADRAARLAGRALAPLYARVDPIRLAEQAHGVQLSGDYIVRVLRRFRSDVDAPSARRLADALVTGYASHGFVVDREELLEIGLAHGVPEAAEAPLVDEVADALLACREDVRVCGAFAPAGIPRGEPGDDAISSRTARPVERAARAGVESAA